MNSPMRVLMVLDSYPPDSQGGAEQMVHGWSRELANRGYEVRVLAGRIGTSQGADEKRDGYRITRWVSKRRSFWDGYYSAVRACRNAVQAINQEWSPHIIHCHQGLSAYAVLSTEVIAPCVCTFHSPWRDEFNEDAKANEAKLSAPIRTLYRVAQFLKGSRIHQMEGYALSRSNGVAVLSSFSRERICKAHQLLPDFVKIVPGAVDINRFIPVSDEERKRIRKKLEFAELTILSVRRLVRRMGLDLLLIAMAQICSFVPNARLVLVGHGPERLSLEMMAKDLGIEKKVTFAGFISDENLLDYYRAADLFVLPSRSLEGFGVSTIEALASGLPVVGTPVGATPEILAPLEGGFVSAKASPEAITQAVIPWLKFPKALQSMRPRCRSYAERHFDWADAGKALVDFYQRVLQV